MSNKQTKVHIMGVPFLNKSKDEFLKEDLIPRILSETKTFIVTANPEIVMAAREDNDYMDTILTADYVVPDGIGIILAAKHKKTPLPERIAGFDLMLDLLEYANKEKLRCFFLGASAQVNEKTVSEVKTRFPDLIIAGHHHGFFDIEDEKVVELVQKSSPDLVFVALGFPKQEQWITQYEHLFSKGVFIGVGGSFDVLAGEVKRAPSIWIKLNLEWLYRIIKQPTRIKRIFKVFKFMWLTYFKK